MTSTLKSFFSCLLESYLRRRRAQTGHQRKDNSLCDDLRTISRNIYVFIDRRLLAFERHILDVCVRHFGRPQELSAQIHAASASHVHNERHCHCLLFQLKNPIKSRYVCPLQITSLDLLIDHLKPEILECDYTVLWF